MTYRWQQIGLPIAVGHSDEVQARLTGRSPNDRAYVACRNTGFGYVGLEVFDLSELQRYPGCDYSEAASVGNLFLQGVEQVTESLGPRWEDFTMNTLTRRLAAYFEEINY